jgi:hypothetical protein
MFFSPAAGRKIMHKSRKENKMKKKWIFLLFFTTVLIAREQPDAKAINTSKPIIDIFYKFTGTIMGTILKFDYDNQAATLMDSSGNQRNLDISGFNDDTKNILTSEFNNLILPTNWIYSYRCEIDMLDGSRISGIFKKLDYHSSTLILQDSTNNELIVDTGKIRTQKLIKLNQIFTIELRKGACIIGNLTAIDFANRIGTLIDSSGKAIKIKMNDLFQVNLPFDPDKIQYIQQPSWLIFANFTSGKINKSGEKKFESGQIFLGGITKSILSLGVLCGIKTGYFKKGNYSIGPSLIVFPLGIKYPAKRLSTIRPFLDAAYSYEKSRNWGWEKGHSYAFGLGSAFKIYKSIHLSIEYRIANEFFKIIRTYFVPNGNDYGPSYIPVRETGSIKLKMSTFNLGVMTIL